MAIEEQDDDNEESASAGGRGATGDFSTVGSKIKDGEYINAWAKLKDENPSAYLAGAIAPGTGQIAAIADYAEAMKAGETLDAASAAASFIPLVKGAKAVSKLAKGHYIGKGAAVMDVGRETKAAVDEKKAKSDSYTGAWDEE